jgi:hypothetical protein
MVKIKFAVNTFGLCPRAISFTNEYCINNSWIFNNYRFINEEIDNHSCSNTGTNGFVPTRQQSFRYQLEISRGDFEDALK